MVKLTRIYTRGGDQGKTSLGSGTRVSKHHLRITAIGEVDEANACLGLVRLQAEGEIDILLEHIQNDLFDVGADLCVPDQTDALRIVEDQVTFLETTIDHYNERLEPLTSFVLPGGSPLSAACHLARTVVRRAERALTKLMDEEEINPYLVQYINRLSDLLFVLGRVANNDGKTDILWTPGKFRNKEAS